MEEVIYFPHKEKIEEYLSELTDICNNVNLQPKKFSIENFAETKQIEKKLDRILTLSNQIRLALSIKIKNPSKNIDEFIVIPNGRTFQIIEAVRYGLNKDPYLAF